MAINVCSICSDTCLRDIIGSENMEGMWRRGIIELLCGISGAVGGGGNVTTLPMKTITAAVLQSTYATYASPSFLDATKKLNDFSAINNTDADIEISLDGGATTAYIVFANSSRQIHVGNYTGAATTSFMIRRASGHSATIGTLYLEGTYAS